MEYTLYMAKLRNYQDELFCKAVAEKKDLAEAYKEINPDVSNNTAYACAREKINNSNDLKNRISELLDKQHLSLIHANKKLKKLLEAKKPIVLDGKIISYDDNTTQLNALEKLYRLHGLLQPGNSLNIDARSVNLDSVNVTVDPARIKSIIDEMARLAEALDFDKHRVKVSPANGE